MKLVVGDVVMHSVLGLGEIVSEEDNKFNDTDHYKYYHIHFECDEPGKTRIFSEDSIKPYIVE